MESAFPQKAASLRWFCHVPLPCQPDHYDSALLAGFAAHHSSAKLSPFFRCSDTQGSFGTTPTNNNE